MGKVVILKLGNGDLEQGFPVILQIGEEGANFSTETLGRLPPAPHLPQYYTDWQNCYHRLELHSRLERPPEQITNISDRECRDAGSRLENSLNEWLNSEEFKTVREKLLEKLQSEDEVRLIFQAEGLLLKLPWHLWKFFEGYTKAEVALGAKTYERLYKSVAAKDKVRILAILGNSSGINIEQDRALLEQLSNAEIVFLVSPQRKEINDQLWEQEGWDILFFAGHSRTEVETGKIDINQNDSLTIGELKNGLRKAIAQGLQLAIFNSCDGIGLAIELAELQIPQVIVMREPVPDYVAQEFLKYFLAAFSQGNSLYLAVRDAREKLQGIEDSFPCASWLPVIFQHPAEVPPTWEGLGGICGQIEQPIFECPYRGLSAFREEHEPFFFGRKKFTESLVKAVKNQPLVGVIGPSGSGKSSVVFAGMIPYLRLERNWLIGCFRPQISPLDELASVIACFLEPDLGETEQSIKVGRLAKALGRGKVSLVTLIRRILAKNQGKKLVLVGDQFEELYTLSQNEERQHFLDELLSAVEALSGQTKPDFIFVFTLRADFWGSVLSYRRFRDAVDRFTPQLLGPMTVEELQETIEKPAEKYGVKFESGLTDRILEDVAQEPGNLPLLEFALTQLWKKQRHKRLTHIAYSEIEGVQKALAKHAEAVYQGLSEDEQKQAQQIFLQLVRPGEATEDTRRLATRAEVGNKNWDLVRRLADESARLVVTGRNEQTREETVEIVHEALIREWGSLRGWMESDRSFRTWQERLRSAIQEWETNEREDGYLWQESPLIEAEKRLHERGDDISATEREFIEKSLELRQGKINKTNHTKRLIGLLVTSFSVVAVISAVVAILGWRRASIGEQNAKLISSSITLEKSFGYNQLDSLIKAIMAGKELKQLQKSSNAGVETQVKVITTLRQIVYNIKEFNSLTGHSDLVNSVMFNHSGQMIASASSDNTIKLWDKKGKLIATLRGHNAPVRSVSFSSDDRIIASASNDGTIKLWKNDGSLITTLSGHRGGVYGVSFSPDGKIIVSSGGDNTIKFWNQQGKLLRILKTNHTNGITSVSFSPDGKMLVSSGNDSSIKLWNSEGKFIRTFNHILPVFDASFSPDGQIIASASYEGIKLWNKDGTLLTTLETNSKVLSVSFSPDGKTIASASYDGIVQLWKKEFWNKNFTLMDTLTGHDDTVRKVVFSPDGQIIASASDDKTIKLWKKESIKLATLTGYNGKVKSISFSPDGKTIAFATDDGRIKLWNQEDKKITTLPGHTHRVTSITFSPDGQIIASASWDRTIKVWNKNGTLLANLKGHKDTVISINFSLDGETITSVSNDETIKLWKKDGTLLSTTQIVYGSSDNPVKIWKKDGNLLAIFKSHSRKVNSINFSRDGKNIVSGSADNTIKLWSKDGTLIDTFIGHSRGGVNSVSLSSNGQLIASASEEKNIKIWNINGILLSTLTGHKNAVNQVNFSPDGKVLASVSNDGQVILWNFDLKDLLVRGCNWVHDYLNNPNAPLPESERHLCEGIVTKK